MTQDELKAQAAHAALDEIPDGAIVGVGTGSTVNHFIDALAGQRQRIRGAVSSSERSSERLRGHGITVFEAGDVQRLPVYVDGADEIDGRGFMIKGGGAALTREKIVADLAERFVCIVDAGKCVQTLGAFALPVEVITMATAQVARRFEALGGRAVLRAGVLTDNGHPLLDVHGLAIADPLALEIEVNQWPGVVTVGLFARHRASLCLVGSEQGVQRRVF
ncbi:ribose-5-phosphate isomerase RpiA [Pseudorhodoferax sp.]|uniref:ribose-5-phosphate isomerase RpiA n=1 Tax=Pseudorhodoferax sp. TaxID=1993553 RepID=UPI002DD64BD1|nr:ribose-5-phosphate isomerase RpiA [Pseudorhodoferax sp.]